MVFVKLELSLRHDTNGVKDHLRPPGDKLFGNAARREVPRDNPDRGADTRAPGGRRQHPPSFSTGWLCGAPRFVNC
jgi:hypothetical protein